MKNDRQFCDALLSPTRQAWLMLVVIAPMAALREQTGHPLLGAMLAQGSSASAAVASVTVKKLQPGKGLMSLTAWQLVAGSVVLLGLSALFELHGTIMWAGGFVGLLLFLVLAGPALSTWLWFWLLQSPGGHSAMPHENSP